MKERPQFLLDACTEIDHRVFQLMDVVVESGFQVSISILRVRISVVELLRSLIPFEFSLSRAMI
jgi:hypothetical protein